MAADLGFVVHAAQARAHELEPHGSRDALAERRLADAGRADEAEDRAAARRIELAHREVLEDAPLDLLEAVVVRVEDLARLRDVDGFRVALRPRQRDEPIEVRAHHRMLRRRVRHAFEAPQLLLSLLLDLLGHLGVRDRLAQLVELALRVVLAELLLDRLQLLAQHVLALALVELALRLLADLARQLQHLDAVRQELDDAIEPVADLQRLEDRLLLGRLDVDEPADHVGERARRLDVLQRRRELGRHLRQQLDGLDGLLLQQRGARLDVGVGRRLGRGSSRSARRGTAARSSSRACESAARPGRSGDERRSAPSGSARRSPSCRFGRDRRAPACRRSGPSAARCRACSRAARLPAPRASKSRASAPPGSRRRGT